MAAASQRPTDGSTPLGRDESALGVYRLRRVGLATLLCWCCFAPIDLLALKANPQTSPLLLLGLRALVAVALAVGVVSISTPRTEAQVRTIVDSLMVLAVWTLGVMALITGGIGSPYAPGMTIVFVARSLIISERALDTLRRLAPALAAWPTLLAIAAAVSPRIRDQFFDPGNQLALAIGAAIVGTGVAYSVVGGHMVWALRERLSADRRLGDYRLGRRLGAGGMGEVWSAWHPRLKREVAVKVLRPSAQSQEARARFEREIKVTAQLSHPNTVRIFDSGVTEEGIWYYTMELLEGEDLDARVRTTGPLTAAAAVRLGQQVAHSLAEAHRQGLVHRDVKPQNIFLARIASEPDLVKVLDFGIAKYLDAEEGAEALTRTGLMAGTPRYMAHEALTGQAVTPASDVYSVGAVLYFALFGRPPYAGETPAAIAVQQAVAPWFDSDASGVPLPQAFEVVLRRCLLRDPEGRPRDGEALSAALRELGGAEFDRWRARPLSESARLELPTQELSQPAR